MKTEQEKNSFTGKIPDDLKNFADRIANAIRKRNLGPSPEIDSLIRARAIALIGSRNAKEAPAGKTGIFKKILYYVSASAAAIVILSGIIFFAAKNDESSRLGLGSMRQEEFASNPNGDQIAWTTLDMSQEIETLDDEITFYLAGLVALSQQKDYSEDEDELSLFSMQNI